MRKTGFVAIVGRSNAGKSTLLNSLIRQKVSIVSPKPQTTRDNILGIWTDEDSQIVFVDTPGELTARNALGEYMVRNISEAIVDVDCVMLVLDGHNGIGDIELSLVKKYATGKIPLVVVVSKIDISQPEKIMPTLVKLNECQGIAEVYCVSAKKNKGIDELKTALKKYLKGTELYFEEDDVTDKPARFLVCEIIREKALLLLE
ncbi:MAG: GTPase Era, partial [Clostridia bacterium]